MNSFQIGQRMRCTRPGIGKHCLDGCVGYLFEVLRAPYRRVVLVVNALLMLAALLAVAFKSPDYLWAAFNPVTLNLAVIALCFVGWIASRSLPTARHCLRRDPKGNL